MRLHQVLVILLSNALDNILYDGQIKIIASFDGSHLHIHMKSEGAQQDARTDDVAPRWNRRFNEDNHLSLNICSNIIDQNRGKIEFH